ncbi:MAG: hypothetical protein H6993_10310 [Pseudomonadales bacterium]|nr:hypothetical protein [Pseudomonadales bacterium]
MRTQIRKAVGIGALLLAGCATTAPVPESPAKPVTSAVVQATDPTVVEPPLSDEPRTAPSTTDAGEHLVGAVPLNWVPVSVTATPALHLAVYQPPDDTPDDTGWTEKLSIEKLTGTPVPDPLEFLAALKEETAESCADSAFHPVSSGVENGYPTAVALLVCPKLSLTEAGQMTMVKVVQGNAAFYSITRAVRTPVMTRNADGEPQQPDGAKEQIGGMSLYLRAMTVCEPGSTAHPCPETD